MMGECEQGLRAYLKEYRFNLWRFRFGLLNNYYKEFEKGWRAGWVARDRLKTESKPASVEGL